MSTISTARRLLRLHIVSTCSNVLNHDMKPSSKLLCLSSHQDRFPRSGIDSESRPVFLSHNSVSPCGYPSGSVPPSPSPGLRRHANVNGTARVSSSTVLLCIYRHINIYISRCHSFSHFRATSADIARVASAEKNAVTLPPPPPPLRVVVCTARRAMISP
jgi:hypothetical protein